MTAKQAIEIINRRAASLQKMYGAHNEVFEQWSTQLTNYDIYMNSKGQLQVKNTAENRKQYRQLTAFAKRIQKTPIQVEQRKAAKYWKEVQEQMQQENEFFDENDIIDMEAYNKWLGTFKDYFEACYELAVMNGAVESYEKYELADQFYNNRDLFVDSWNYFYKQGAFDEYTSKYEEQQFRQQYDVDEITGEAIEKADFYRGL